MTTNFTCDFKSPSSPLPHFWEHTVGSGHATLALRADWQKQLHRCHKELGFEHVRFHGILSDDMGTLMAESDKLVYSFFNADQIFDFLLSIGMKPFAELSFMPSTLSSGPDTVFHYKANVTPPKSYKAWEKLIQKIVQHWVDRYGIEIVREWFFEIWNEPNLPAFWKGTQQKYFLLYKHAAKAIKSVDKELKVGGPASADNAWIPEFRSFCEKNKVPYDFISTHHYPTDDFGQPGDDTLTQLADSKRSVLRDEVIKTRKQAGKKPIYYTEWCTSSNPFDDLHDMPYASAFIIKTVMEAHNQIQGYSYWTFSDIFEENYFSSAPFHGGFGLLNIYGIPKPAYRGYEILHRLGNDILSVEGKHPTVDVWVVCKKGTVNIVLTNSALPRHPVKTALINISLNNIKKIKKTYIEKIDDTHANARVAWSKIGSPAYLSSEQVELLELASTLIKEPLLFRPKKDSVLLEIEIPPQGTVLVTLEI